MKEIGVGLIGFGTVGAGVVEGLQRNGDLMASRAGVRLVLRRIADLDLERDRGVKIDRALLTRDARGLIEEPGIDVIVELIGGVGIAKDLVEKALGLGKPIVTANKKLLAEHGASLFALAEEKHAGLYFEASVGGGIPIIRALREGLIANNISDIYAILNGTCNYILTRMEHDHLPFDHVLKEAQSAGYAEAEPSLDIDGIDTAHKAAILASLAHGFPVPMSAVHVEGIRGLAQDDIVYAGELGYRIKLLAIIKLSDGHLLVRVHPTLVPLDHMLASVGSVFNAVMVRGDIVGETLYYGRGAGRLPTASAVLSDLADVGRRLSAGAGGHLPAYVKSGRPVNVGALGDSRARYYLRFSLMDKPGALAQVAQILGRHDISIASMIQKEERRGDHVPVIIITHTSEERNFQAALKEIDGLDSVDAKTIRLRIEDFGSEK